MNLIIIGITQFILQYFVIQPRVSFVVLDGILLPLFILTTVIIGASGYLINDIMDQKTDTINKPQAQFVGNHISEIHAWAFYLILIIVGALISVFIAHESDTWSYIWLYPFATWSMYLYSRFLKATVLWGNIFVSLFVAFVWGVLFLAQNTHDSIENHFLKEICLVYMSFAFLSNLLREIIKDIQDMDGDSHAGLVTLPIKFGVNNTKLIVKILTYSLMLILTFWVFMSSWTQTLQTKAVILLFIIAPLGRFIIKLIHVNDKSEFGKLSSLLKWVMLAGLVSIVVISKNV